MLGAGVTGDVAEGQAGVVDFTEPALHPHSVREQKQSQVARYCSKTGELPSIDPSALGLMSMVINASPDTALYFPSLRQRYFCCTEEVAAFLKQLCSKANGRFGQVISTVFVASSVHPAGIGVLPEKQQVQLVDLQVPVYLCAKKFP